MNKQTFMLRNDQIDKLDGISHRTGVPKAELIRRAIDTYLSYKEDEERREWLQRNLPKTA